MLENASRQFFLVLLAIVAGLVCIATLSIPLGTDLKGGTQLLYEVPEDVLEQLKTKENVSADQVLDQTLSVIRDRIDPTGSLDPLITRSGDTGILIELPDMTSQDLKQVLERITNLGKLEMRIVADDDFQKENVRFNMAAETGRLNTWLEKPENKELIQKDARNIRRFNEDPTGPMAFPNLAWYPRQVRPSPQDPKRWDISYTDPRMSLQKSTVKAYDDAQWNNGLVPAAMLEKPEKDRFLIEFLAVNMKERHFTGEDLDPTGVSAGPSQRGGLGVHYAIVGPLTGDYATWSEEYIGKSSAIVLNGFVKSAPVFRSKIPGNGIIEGDFTRTEVEELVKVLRTGSLRVEPELQSRNQIGATLGEEAINRGVFSLIAGAVLVFAFVLFYYGIAGTIACITLLLNVFLLFAAMMFMQATITLPGLGGIVLTLGMAVDANVLIYERIREELQKGKEMLQAVRAGFERAMSAIIDSNITTFLVGVVLYNVGVGPVRGFAVTLMVGILTTVFTQFFVTRLLFHYALEKNKLAGWKPRQLFEERNIDFVRHILKCLTVSGLVIVAGIAYATLRAPREVTLGMDFTGGANLQMVLSQPMTSDEVRARLAGDADFSRDYPNAAVNTVGAAVDGKTNQFNVRLKLDERLRDEIQEGRKQWRTARKQAEAEGKAEPDSYEPPYVAQLRRVFQQELVQPAFGNPMATPHATFQNQQYAQVDVHFQQPVLLAEVREKLSAGLAQCGVDAIGDETAAEARDVRVSWITSMDVKDWEFDDLVATEIAGLKDAKGADVVLSEPFPQAQEIQGRLVNDLRNAAIGSLLLACGLIVLYLRVRFHEYRYGVAAVIALIHDVLVTFGFVVVFNHLGIVHAEINLAMIACFLTIIGYSVNDTIVVFDRIRENRIENARAGIDESFRSLINRSLNQTLSRTVLTTVLTLFVVLAQFLVNWGSESDLESFAFAMIIGMISGVYSTIYIASPILIWLDSGEPPVLPAEPQLPAEASVAQEA